MVVRVSRNGHALAGNDLGRTKIDVLDDSIVVKQDVFKLSVGGMILVKSRTYSQV